MSVWHAILGLGRTQLELLTLRRKLSLVHRMGTFVAIPAPSKKLLVVVVHVVDPAASHAAERLNSLELCIASICSVMAAYQVTIQLLTCRGMHLYDQLSPSSQQRVTLTVADISDPMYIGLEAFKIFGKHERAFDYFIFLEDDIVLHDSWMIEKIALFDEYIPNEQFLLQPHRFEWANGQKYYLDQLALAGIHSPRYTICPGTTLAIHGVRFCAFENPHVGMHILSSAKLSYWMKQGNPWGEQVSGFGPLESTATYHLMRCFTFMQPHPDNMHYLEVQHYGEKYFHQHLQNGKLRLPQPDE